MLKAIDNPTLDTSAAEKVVDTFNQNAIRLFATEEKADKAFTDASSDRTVAREATQEFRLKIWWEIRQLGGAQSPVLIQIMDDRDFEIYSGSKLYFRHIQLFRGKKAAGINNDADKKAYETGLARDSDRFEALDFLQPLHPDAFKSLPALKKFVKDNGGLDGMVKLRQRAETVATPEYEEDKLGAQLEAAKVTLKAPSLMNSTGLGFFRVEGGEMKFIPINVAPKVIGSMMGYLPAATDSLPDDINFLGEMFGFGNVLCPNGVSSIPRFHLAPGDEPNETTEYEGATSAYLYDSSRGVFSIAQTRCRDTFVIEVQMLGAGFAEIKKRAKGELLYIQSLGMNILAGELSGETSRLLYRPEKADGDGVEVDQDKKGVIQLTVKRRVALDDPKRARAQKLRLVGMDQFTSAKPRWTFMADKFAATATATIDEPEITKLRDSRDGFMKAGTAKNQKERVVVAIRNGALALGRGKNDEAVHSAKTDGTASLFLNGADIKRALVAILAMQPASLTFSVDPKGMVAIAFETRFAAYKVVIPALDPDIADHDVRLTPMTQVGTR